MKVVDLYNMDCRDAMSLFLPDNSVDAIAEARLAAVKAAA